MTLMKPVGWLVILLIGLSGLSGYAQSFPEDSSVSSIDWNPNGEMIAISDGAATVRILDADSLTTINVLPQFPYRVTALRWDDTGNQLAIAGDWSMQIWEQPWASELAALSLSLEVPIQLGFFTIESIDWNGRDQQILTVASTQVFIWDSETGELVRTIEPYTTPLLSATWSDDNTRLAWGSLTGYVIVEDLASQEFGGEDTYDFDGIFALAWSSDASTLAVGTNSGLIQFYSGSGRRFGSAGLLLAWESPVFSLDWHPTSNLLAVGRADGTLEIWNTDMQYQENLLIRFFTAFPVVSVAWSPDGRRLAYNDGNTLSMMPAPVIGTQPDEFH